MKTKEELLKIYSAYLPYGFEVKTGMGYTYEVLGITRNLYDRHGDVGLLTELGWINMEESLNNKPILYSMEMLTQEIEHKGERFIPIEKLEYIFSFPKDKCFLLRDVVNSLSDFFFTKDLTDIFRFKTVIEIHNKLLEWHFNVFGLEESEYIKK